MRLTDLDLMRPQGVQEEELRLSRDSCAIAITKGPAWSVVDDGHVVALGGIQIIYRGRGLAWALVADDITASQRHRAVRHAYKSVRQARWMGIQRLEATCIAGWVPGQRLLCGLGFVREATMRKFGPDGSDHELWARIEE